MTQFTKDMIPTSIVTTEALAVWLAELHNYLYPTTTSVEALQDNGEPIKVRVAESNKFFLTAPTTPGWRHISRLSVGIRPEHQSTGKLWNHVEVLGDRAVPDAFKT